MFLDGGQAQRAVAPGPRQDDANGILALVAGKREHVRIDWPPVLSRRRWFDNDEAAICDGKSGVGRNNKHVVGLNLSAIRCFGHGHGRALAQDFGEHAFAVGSKVLYEHESHAAVRGHILEEGSERFESARRCADAHNEGRRPLLFFGRGARRLRDV